MVTDTPRRKETSLSPGINKFLGEALNLTMCAFPNYKLKFHPNTHNQRFTKAIITHTQALLLFGQHFSAAVKQDKCHQSGKVKTDPCNSAFFRSDDSLRLLIYNVTVWEGEKEMKRKRVGCVVHIICFISDGFFNELSLRAL